MTKVVEGSMLIRFFLVFQYMFIIGFAFPRETLESASKQAKVLVFTKTIPYYHQSIPSGIAALQKLGRENEFVVEITNDSSSFTSTNLKQYSTVIFLSTTGDVFNDREKEAFIRYIQSDKGFVGIHSATDTEHGWPWYNELVGAHFMSHPIEQNATLNIVDRKFIATKHLPQQWKRFDEWYSFKGTHWNDVHVLITIDETSYIGGEHGQFHPMSWYHRFDGGRSFYTQLSHRDESYQDPLFTQHLLGGILYAMYGKTT